MIIATFRKPTATSPRPPEPPGNTYFVIALTTLRAETGILNFFPVDGDGARLGQSEVLEPGDGLVCRGEDLISNGGGEGGVVLMIRYQGGGTEEKIG